MKDDDVMTTEDVMEYLHVNRRTVYRLMPKGLPGFRVGRQWRFRKRDVDVWLERSHLDKGDAAERPRILVVDDEAPIRDLILKHLRHVDWEADGAADGPAAIDFLRESDYDLVITDLRMPGMDGLSVVREARRKSLDMPIIIITGNSTEASAIEALNLGVTAYLTKPFRMVRLLQIAARAMHEDLPELPADVQEGFRPQ